jgi:hypothetical protein
MTLVVPLPWAYVPSAAASSPITNSGLGCWRSSMAWCKRRKCFLITWRRCAYKAYSFVTHPTASDELAPSQRSKPAHPFSAATLVSGEDFSTHTTAQSRGYGRRRTHGMPSSQDSSLVDRSRYEEATSRCEMARYHVLFCWRLLRVYQLGSTA